MSEIPFSVLNYLRCDLCSCWLSCGPVFVLPSSRSICGRCTNNTDYRFKLRHVTYETVARFYKFPCKYYKQHCKVLLGWNEAPEHEQHCLYRSHIFKYCAKPQLIFKKEKILNFNQDLILYDVPEDLLVYLSCFLCGGYLSSTPIIITREGNNICHRCFKAHGAPENRPIRHVAFEIILETFIFPCTYRNTGCTVSCRFGEEIYSHELECSYGGILKKTRKTKCTSGNKERGVIETHTGGHVYATLTPNKPLFAPPYEMEKQGQFLNEFQKHRETLTTKWGVANSYSIDNEHRERRDQIKNFKNNHKRYNKDHHRTSDNNNNNNNNRYHSNDDDDDDNNNNVEGYYVDSVEFGQTIRHNLIDELKLKQKRRSEDIISVSSSRVSSVDNNYYYNEYVLGKNRKPKKIEYSVY